MVLGTVGYMSPEQVRGETVDTRSDIFAFGAILYEMLTGARAFKRGSSIETLSAILKEDPPDLAESLPNVPPALERLDAALPGEGSRAALPVGARSRLQPGDDVDDVDAGNVVERRQSRAIRDDARCRPIAPRRTSATAIRPVTSAMPATVRTAARPHDAGAADAAPRFADPAHAALHRRHRRRGVGRLVLRHESHASRGAAGGRRFIA